MCNGCPVYRTHKGWLIHAGSSNRRNPGPFHTAGSRPCFQFYEKDSGLIEALSHHIGAALVAGDTAIVIATQAHRAGLLEELRLRKISVSSAIKAGRCIELDATETLAQFMVHSA